MDAMTAVTAAATLVTSVTVAWAAARKVAGGEALSRALAAALREEREVRMPVVLVALDAALDRAADLRTMLVGRGFRAVRCQAAESYRQGSEVFVFLAYGDGAGEALTKITSAGQCSGLIFTAPGFRPPAGDWTFANSAVSLYARLRELIAFNRAAEGPA